MILSASSWKQSMVAAVVLVLATGVVAGNNAS